MAEYKVEWVEAHDAIVDARTTEEALQIAVQMDDTFDKVFPHPKITETTTEYEMEWRETHRTKLRASNENDAKDNVLMISRNGSTTFAGIVDDIHVCTDADNHGQLGADNV